jgi:arsenite methyltransferase
MIALINSDDIKAAVREHYASRIQSGSCCGTSASCCSDSASTEVALYGADTIAALPNGVVTTSFGCGNPLAIASLKEGEVVLDLGSGGGLDVLLAAQKVGATGYVYGLDMTDEMLAVVRRNAEKAGATNVAFLKGDIEAIPLPDSSVSVIISNCVIKPGGRLAVSDIVIDGDLAGLPVSEAQIRAGLSWAGCIAGALTRDQYQALLSEAGFTDVALDVKHRYALNDLLSDTPADLKQIPEDVLAQLVERFTSCAIGGIKPAQ